MFDESKHPRANDGKFTDGGKVSKPVKNYDLKKAVQALDEIDKRNKRDRSTAEKTVLLPKKEYAEFCSSVRTKYADRIPKQGQMLYGGNYYRFRYSKSQERIVCTFRLRIEGNERKINNLFKEFDNE